MTHDDTHVCMKVLFLGHAHTNGCRSAYYFPHLAEERISARYVDVPSGPARAAFLAGLPPADCVVIGRLALLPEEMAVLRGLAGRIVYDVDDPIMYRSSRHWIQRSLTRRRNFRRMVESADAVIAGTPLIAEEAARYIAPDRVVLIPSTVDGNVYTPRLSRATNHEPLCIGWLGSAGTAGYLARLRHVLAEVGRKVPGARLKIVSNRFPEIEGIPVEKKIWCQADEVADLQSFDVALLPLSDDLWTRGKGHGKLFQYMAVGAAIVASPVGIVEACLTQGRTGFFARNKAEWVGAIRRLCEDAPLCAALGRAARSEFEKRFSLRATLPALLAVLRGGSRAKP